MKKQLLSILTAGCLMAAMVPAAVSYTHLDVYKRQKLHHAG